ncbi:hypothetical protein CERSUDRAFT_87901 [Gelatoporia subvermispora B]|uniref:Uncharacterized protein n=1 Tax=Ceriporiopsis subvermispora (strain B) TaxID=914234 RepID=M2QKD1_CERS8|nr:hypothetical protein CERSUDRAFT_87901 [Gelatoporia subvermispora B]
MAEVPAQRAPAMKVGGRRLSVTTRPKPHPAPAEAKPPSPDADTPTDYPRPAPPGEQHEHEEEPPRKEKRRGNGGDEHERRLQEDLYRKAEQNRPRRDVHGRRNSVGGGGRISQPAGKNIAV